MSGDEAHAAVGWFDVLGEQRVYEGYSDVVVVTVRTPDGDEVQREIVEHDDAVAVVATTPGDEVVLLRQYRQPVRGYVLEIPAGTLDVDGEDPLDAATRELAEEVQYRADDLEYMTTFHNSAGWSTERTHLYLARDVSPTPPPDGFEPQAEEADMEVLLLPFAAAVEQARRGEITDAKTVVGLLLAAERR